MRSISVLMIMAALLLLACPKPQGYSGALAGTIRNDDGTALADAQVTTIPSTSVVFTDAAGHFRLDGVRAGSYQLLADCAGHVALSREVAVVASETTSVDINLGLSAPPSAQTLR